MLVTDYSAQNNFLVKLIVIQLAIFVFISSIAIIVAFFISQLVPFLIALALGLGGILSYNLITLFTFKPNNNSKKAYLSTKIVTLSFLKIIDLALWFFIGILIVSFNSTPDQQANLAIANNYVNLPLLLLILSIPAISGFLSNFTSSI